VSVAPETSAAIGMFDSASDRNVTAHKPPTAGNMPRKLPGASRMRPDLRNPASPGVQQKPGFRGHIVPGVRMHRSVVVNCICC